MNGRVDHHGRFIGIIIHDFFIHLEKVSILVLYHILAQTVYRIFKIQVYRQSRANTMSGITSFLGSP